MLAKARGTNGARVAESLGAAGVSGAEGGEGLSKAELVRKKLQAKQLEREQQLAARSTGAPLAVPRRRSAAGATSADVGAAAQGGERPAESAMPEPSVAPSDDVQGLL